MEKDRPKALDRVQGRLLWEDQDISSQRLLNVFILYFFGKRFFLLYSRFLVTKFDEYKKLYPAAIDLVSTSGEKKVTLFI